MVSGVISQIRIHEHTGHGGHEHGAHEVARQSGKDVLH
jgi:hypothetical protein